MQRRQRIEQPARVGMGGAVEDVCDRRAFDDPAAVHHHDPVGELRDDAEVMGNQDERHALLRPNLGDELEDLGLDRNVERRGGFVGDENVGLPRQGHGDHDPLVHAAGELVRVFVEPPAGIADAHAVQKAPHLRPRRGPLETAVKPQRLAELAADGVDRVKRA